MATFTDDFNRADGALGANWTTLAGSGSIVSNRLSINLTGTTLLWAAATDTTDHYSSIALQTYVAGNTYGVFVRSDGTTANMYQGRRTAAGSFDIRRIVANAATVIGSATIAPPADGAILRLEAVGSQIRMLVAGVPIIDVVDTNLSVGKRLGVRHQLLNGTVSYDTFAAGDLSAASPAVTRGSVSARSLGALSRGSRRLR